MFILFIKKQYSIAYLTKMKCFSHIVLINFLRILENILFYMCYMSIKFECYI